MGTRVAAIAIAATLAGISGVLAPSDARSEDGHRVPPGLARIMAEGAGRIVETPERTGCAWARDFVRRYGRERAIEIARLDHADAEIEAWRRLCFPESRPINGGR